MNTLKLASIALAAFVASNAAADAQTPRHADHAWKTGPVWDLARDGGPLAERLKAEGAILLDDKGFDVPCSAIPDATGFTVEAVVEFREAVDNSFLALLNQEVSETGWGLGCLFRDSWASPLRWRCNGAEYQVSYGMRNVKPGTTHVFTIAVRKGLAVVYMDGRPQRRFFMVPVPNVEPIHVGWTAPGRWEVLRAPAKQAKGVAVKSLTFWGADEEYRVPGEPVEIADGFRGGKGWMLETPATETAALPRILYVGDSISDGYTNPFKVAAKGKARLYHWNHCDGDVRKIDARVYSEVARFAKYDAIVFNNGLHSLHWTCDTTSDAQIAAHYRMIVRAYRKDAPQAKLLYLLTTPHTAKKGASGKVEALGEKDAIVQRLNRIASGVMAEEGVEVIDAYALMAARLADARGDQYHWNPPAYKALAQLVCDRALAAIGKSATANGEARK